MNSGILTSHIGSADILIGNEDMDERSKDILFLQAIKILEKHPLIKPYMHMNNMDEKFYRAIEYLIPRVRQIKTDYAPLEYTSPEEDQSAGFDFNGIKAAGRKQRIHLGERKKPVLLWLKGIPVEKMTSVHGIPLAAVQLLATAKTMEKHGVMYGDEEFAGLRTNEFAKILENYGCLFGVYAEIKRRVAEQGVLVAGTKTVQTLSKTTNVPFSRNALHAPISKKKTTSVIERIKSKLEKLLRTWILPVGAKK